MPPRNKYGRRRYSARSSVRTSSKSYVRRKAPKRNYNTVATYRRNTGRRQYGSRRSASVGQRKQYKRGFTAGKKASVKLQHPSVHAGYDNANKRAHNVPNGGQMEALLELMDQDQQQQHMQEADDGKRRRIGIEV